MPRPSFILERFDQLVAAFRPTVGNNRHIEVMEAIGKTRSLIQEQSEAKSAKKITRLAKEIYDSKLQVVWMFYGKPASMDDIK